MDAQDPRRRACKELARQLTEPEHLRFARRLQSAGAFDRRHRQASPEAAPRGRPRPISIWQPELAGQEIRFTRPPPLPFGDHYAATPTLRAAKPEGCQRICYFGESAAAGYLYAPRLTPARVLQAQLDHAAGTGRFEVVDLARTNERLETLVATFEASLQLAPDLCVIFTGNNWNLLEATEVSAHAPSVRARQAVAEALREKGLYGPIELGARRVLERAGAALARIAAIAAEAAVPVVLVVPEVNLADWETRQPVAWLPRDGTARWYRHYRAALACLAEGRWPQLVGLAEQMLALDDSTCPSSHRLLALGRLGLGDEAGSAAACRAEIASCHHATLAALPAPQATPMSQELLRRAARHHGFDCVDLTRIFAQHTGSPLPGRRLFLDYCHLTPEGMRVAMAAVAETALRRLGSASDGPSWRDLAGADCGPHLAPAQDATAKFGAAIHGAHRLLPVRRKAPFIEHWCREALLASPGVASTMLDFVAARCAPCPAVLTAAQERVRVSPYSLGFQHGWRYRFPDFDVIAAIARVLAESDRESARQVEDLVVAHLGKLGRGERADPALFLAEPLDRFFPEVMELPELTGRAFYRAPWPETTWCLVAEGPAAREIELVARLPEPPGADAASTSEASRVSWEINGSAGGELTLARRWSRQRIHLAAGSLRRGVNRLTLRWPAPPPGGETALAAAAERLELGLEADLHPDFGEVFSFDAV